MSVKYSKIGSIQKESDIARLMSLALEQPDILNLAAGFTDNATLPLSEVASVVERLLEEGDKTILQYGSNQGRVGLRTLIRNRIEKADSKPEGAYCDSDLLIANGSQQILYLAIQTLCNPGDIILVEQPTYFVFLELLRGLDVTPVPMPMRSDGDIDTDGLLSMLLDFKSSRKIEKIKALYLVSYYANPSGHSVSLNAKKRIGRALEEADADIAVIEDAAYRELYFETPHEAPSCMALNEYANMPVLYTSTLTKPFASGLKVGYGYCSDKEWLQKILSIKGQQDFGTANFTQSIAEKVLQKGIFDKHLSALRSTYHSKMLKLHECLDSELKALDWSWAMPLGGLYLWLKSPEDWRTDFDSSFHKDCIESGVMYVPGDLCFAEGKPKDQIRLSFGVLSLDGIREAAGRFLQAASQVEKVCH